MEPVAAGFVGILGIGFIVFMLVFAFLYSVGVYLLNSLPLYMIGKKLGYEKKYLAFIPIMPFFSLYVLSNLPGRKDFSINPWMDSKLKITERKKSFAIFCIIYAVYYVLTLLVNFGISFVNSLFTTLMAGSDIVLVISAITSVVSVLASCVIMVCGVLVSIYHSVLVYVYLRDLMDIFNPDRQKNKTLALIIAIVNNFTAGLALPIYLCVLSRKEPLPEEPDEFFSEEGFNAYDFSQVGEPPYFHEVDNAEDIVTEENEAPAENTEEQ